MKPVCGKTKSWLNTSKTCSGVTPSSRNALSLCGVFFDAPAAHDQLAAFEEIVSAPDFWDHPEKAQAVLQDRKVLEERVNAGSALDSRMSDIDTYFHLAQEESNDAQRSSILEDVAKEIAAADKYLSDLETKTLLAGESDRLNAIVTVKPGAGGTESQDWAEMLLRMYIRWAEDKGFRANVLDSTPGEEAGIKTATGGCRSKARTLTACWPAKAVCTASCAFRRTIRPRDATPRLPPSCVIPEIDDRIEIVIKPDDLKLDTFRAGGRAARTSTG